MTPSQQRYGEMEDCYKVPSLMYASFSVYCCISRMISAFSFFGNRRADRAACAAAKGRSVLSIGS